MYYKVLTNINGKLVSPLISKTNQELAVRYFPNKWVRAKNFWTDLFVFNNLKDCKYFIDWLSMENIEIWSCQVVLSSTPIRTNCNIIKGIDLINLNYLISLRKSGIEFENHPMSEYIYSHIPCRKIKLLEKIK